MVFSYVSEFLDGSISGLLSNVKGRG